MAAKKDVLVIGACVIGCSIAYHLGRKGIASLVVDRNGIGDRASGKAWGLLEYHKLWLAGEKDSFGFWVTPEGRSFGQWFDLYESSFHRLPGLSADIKERGGIDVEHGDLPSINLVFNELEEAYYREKLAKVRALGDYKCHWMGPEEVKQIYPDISPDVRGGMVSPQQQVEPYKYTLGLAQAAESMGAEFRSGQVVGFKTGGGKIEAVALSSGVNIEADRIVIALGPWTTQAASWLGGEMPLSVVMEECLCLEAPDDFPMHSLHGRAHHDFGYVEIVRKVNGELILASAEVMTPQEYWDLKARPSLGDGLNEEVKRINIAAAVSLLPGLEEARLVTHRGDLLAYGPAPNYHQPIMGRLPEWENGFVATGFGGLGI